MMEIIYPNSVVRIFFDDLFHKRYKIVDIKNIILIGLNQLPTAMSIPQKKCLLHNANEIPARLKNINGSSLNTDVDSP